MKRDGQVFVFGVAADMQESRDYAKGVVAELRKRGVENFATSLPENMQSFFEDAVRARGEGRLLDNIKFSNGDGFDVHATSLAGIVDLAAEASKGGMTIHCVGAPISMKRAEGLMLLAEAENLPPQDRAGRIAEVNAEEYQHQADRVSQISGGTVLFTGVLNVGGRGATTERLREMGIEATGTVIFPRSGRGEGYEEETRRAEEVARFQNPGPESVVLVGEAGTVPPSTLVGKLADKSGNPENIMTRMSERVSQMLSSIGFPKKDGERAAVDSRDGLSSAPSQLPQRGGVPARGREVSSGAAYGGEVNANNKIEEVIVAPKKAPDQNLAFETIRSRLGNPESPAQQRKRESEEMTRLDRAGEGLRKLEEDNDKFKKWQKERREAGLTATPNEYSTEKRELERNGPTIYMQAGAVTGKPQKPLSMPSCPLKVLGDAGRGGGGF